MINNVFNFLDYSNTDGPHSLIVLTGAIQVTMDDGGELFSLTSGLEGFLHESDGPDDGQARCAKCGSKEAADCPMASKTKCRWCHIVHMLVYGEVTWKETHLSNPMSLTPATASYPNNITCHDQWNFDLGASPFELENPEYTESLDMNQGVWQVLWLND